MRVCDGVSYAHRHLIVHRDLKPSNIIVDASGRPKLLDFGIAKLLDETGDATQTVERLLTPNYASPEQLGGVSQTTATDVYSLGAVLYKLVTGRSPHETDAATATAISVITGTWHIVPPSRLNPAIPGDIDFIVQKALRTEPEERYASVDALANDVMACLEWRAVEARSGDVWYRSRKLLRRYWVPLAATALVIVSLSTGLYVANRQRLIAERRFAQLRQLSNRVIDLDREIRTLPGSVAARGRLVAASLEYLEGLSQEARGNLDLAQEVADGYWRMARIQGVNAEYNLGQPAKADDSLKKADSLIETVLATRPNSRGALFRSAVIAHDRMILTDNEQRRPVTELHARKSAARLEEFLRHDDPQDPVRLDGFLRPGDARQSEADGASNLFANIANAFVNMHLYADAARFARRSVAIAQSVPSAQLNEAAGLSILANALRYQGDVETAVSTIRQARRISEQVNYPSDTARLFARYGLMLREARILGEAEAVNFGQPAEAIGILQEALDLTEAAVQKDASDSASRNRVGTTARELGRILNARDPQRALAVYDLGIQRLSEIRNSLKARREVATLLARSS